MIDFIYAECIVSILLDEDGNEKVKELRFDGLITLYGIAEMYRKEGFLPDLVEAFFVKKSQMILKANSKSEVQKILKPSTPRYIAGKAVPEESPYYVEEEELILWSRTSLRGPLNDAGYSRYWELLKKLLPEKAELIKKKGA